jgi:hypothetical protein
VVGVVVINPTQVIQPQIAHKQVVLEEAALQQHREPQPLVAQEIHLMSHPLRGVMVDLFLWEYQMAVLVVVVQVPLVIIIRLLQQ